jgi:hypothetical protein
MTQRRTTEIHPDLALSHALRELAMRVEHLEKRSLKLERVLAAMSVMSHSLRECVDVIDHAFPDDPDDSARKSYGIDEIVKTARAVLKQATKEIG